MKTVLLTGGAGFIGHHTVEHILKNTDWRIVIMDRLSYAGNLNRLTDMDIWETEGKRCKFIYHDFRAILERTIINLMPRIDYIIHMGAETHVDRSITDPMPFVTSNVVGTVNMLNLGRSLGVNKFILVSTDEVYGPVPKMIDGLMLHVEGDPHRPGNPYSASKAAAEDFARAYYNTYQLPVIITNTMNNFGERQDPEKFVPRTIHNILTGNDVVIHCKMDADGKVIDISSRCWLHARNHADALIYLLEHGDIGGQYNITGELFTVEYMAQMIAGFMGKDLHMVYEDFHSFRPGHDMHYGLDGTKLELLGWKPPINTMKSLQNTVEWTVKNNRWLL